MANVGAQDTGATWGAWSGGPSAWTPAVDVYETAEACVVIAEVAGAEDFQLELAGDRRALSLRGRRTRRPALLGQDDPAARPPAGSAPHIVCHQLEIAAGPFERRVALPCAVDGAAADARFDDGLLVVLLPKVRSRGPVRVRVSAGPAEAAAAATTTATTRTAIPDSGGHSR